MTPEAKAAAASSELVEVVDLDGTVERLVTRAEMRANALRHRCTYVLVLTGDDRVVVHQRAEWKDVSPGVWDIAFGGVCDPGEDWDTAADRELAEEAGLVGQRLEPLGPVSFEDPLAAIVGHVYWTRSDDEVTCPDGEVQAVDYVPLATIGPWLDERPPPPDSAELLVPILLAWSADGAPDRRHP